MEDTSIFSRLLPERVFYNYLREPLSRLSLNTKDMDLVYRRQDKPPYIPCIGPSVRLLPFILTVALRGTIQGRASCPAM